MIKLKIIKENIFVYNVEDWIKLRKTHRIIGHIIGNTNLIPSLPSKLMPEEALLLLEQNLAELYENNDQISIADNTAGFEEDLLNAQQDEYRKIRQQQLSTLIDKIVEKRRKLGDERTKEAILNEELEKSCVVTKENMLWPILLQDSGTVTLKSIKDILPLTTRLKSEVFKDLWEKDYYITSGEKFGGDFLAYFGDPIIHHAIFIIKCIDNEKLFIPTELIAFGRLGVSVKKRAVLASLKNDRVSYVTINWIDA